MVAEDRKQVVKRKSSVEAALPDLVRERGALMTLVGEALLLIHISLGQGTILFQERRALQTRLTVSSQLTVKDCLFWLIFGHPVTYGRGAYGL